MAQGQVVLVYVLTWGTTTRSRIILLSCDSCQPSVPNTQPRVNAQKSLEPEVILEFYGANSPQSVYPPCMCMCVCL